MKTANFLGIILFSISFTQVGFESLLRPVSFTQLNYNPTLYSFKIYNDYDIGLVSDDDSTNVTYKKYGNMVWYI